MKVSALQTALAPGDRRTNQKRIAAMTEQAMQNGPDVVVLPELWDLGFFPSNAVELGDPDGREARDFLGALAARHAVNIVGGSIVRRVGDTARNTCYVFDRRGDRIAQYDKIHLFSPSGENRTFEPGESKTVFSLDGVPAGVCICYDLRFGELVRMLALAGAEALFVPSAWPHPRLEHWRLLCRTRALENQCFLIGVNGCGNNGAVSFCGHSMAVDPWGEVLAEAEEEATCLTAEFDFAVLKDIRSRINVFQDRRPDLYCLDAAPEREGEAAQTCAQPR